MRADGHHIHLSQDGSLIVSNVQEADEGSYTCNAYSSSSSVSASTEVKVLRNRPISEYNLVTLLLLCPLCVPVHTLPWSSGGSKSLWVVLPEEAYLS